MISLRGGKATGEEEDSDIFLWNALKQKGVCVCEKGKGDTVCAQTGEEKKEKNETDGKERQRPNE
jgi:hypothetical protein